MPDELPAGHGGTDRRLDIGVRRADQVQGRPTCHGQPGPERQQLGDAAARGEPTDLDHAVLARRRWDLGRDPGQVRHDRMLTPEACPVAVLGEEQRHVPLGPPLQCHRGAGDGPSQPGGDPAAVGQAGRQVLVDIEHHGNAPADAARDRQQQLRIVEEDEVVAGGEPTDHTPGGQQRRQPVPADGPREVDHLGAGDDRPGRGPRGPPGGGVGDVPAGVDEAPQLPVMDAGVERRVDRGDDQDPHVTLRSVRVRRRCPRRDPAGGTPHGYRRPGGPTPRAVRSRRRRGRSG